METRSTGQSERRCKRCGRDADTIGGAYEFCGKSCEVLWNRSRCPGDMLARAGVPRRYQGCTFEFMQNGESIKARLDSFIRHDASMVFLTGNVGAGKTHTAVALLREVLLQRAVDGLFVVSTKLFLDLRRTFDSGMDSEHKILERHLRLPLVIFDDLGSEKPTEYVRQSWYHVIDGRYSDMKQTVITSNLSLDAISDVYGDRIASRISSGVVISFGGEDYRLRLREQK